LVTLENDKKKIAGIAGFDWIISVPFECNLVSIPKVQYRDRKRKAAIINSELFQSIDLPSRPD